MSSFDTRTNTSSVTFTNSYNTATFMPSPAFQQVYGFERTTGKRYFEYYIDDGGGTYLTTDKPYVGILGYGTSSNLYGPLVPGGATISTGDIFMFAVDFGGGTDHLGNVKWTTLSDGSGNLLLPVFVDIGKDGTWYTDQWGFVNWKYLAGGKSGWQKPHLARIATSTSAVTISLRVNDADFFYPIPSGFTEWGDGPDSGSLGASSTYGVAWDPTRISGNISLSQNDQIAKWTVGGALAGHWVYSLPLAQLTDAAGMRMIEFTWGGVSGSDSVHAPSFALVDANAGAGQFSMTVTSTFFYFFPNASPNTFRGLSYDTAPSLTNEAMFSTSGKVAGSYVQQFVVDHTNQFIWATNWSGTTYNGLWSGRENAAALASPYKGTGTDGVTITDSIGLRWGAKSWTNRTLSYCEINIGQNPFVAYPLMMGVLPYNGNRKVYGNGDTWQTGLTSVTYSHSNCGISTYNPNIVHIATSGGKFSGKLFFQVYHGLWNNPGLNMVYTTGLRPAASTTLSAAAHTKNNLVWEYGDAISRLCRYSTTTTISWNITVYAADHPQWESIAVDFDTGKLWFGHLNTRTRTNQWIGGGNPAAGTGANMTFTASTTMKAFTWLSGQSPYFNMTTIFVAEQGNLVDIPSGFEPWNPPVYASLTATPSGTSSGTGSALTNGGLRVLWPYGVMT